MKGLLVAFLVLLGCLAAQGAFDPFKAAGIDRLPDAAVPMELSFADADGKVATLAEFGDGKPVLFVPVLHNCPNICGVTLSGLFQAIAAQDFLPGRDFNVIAFGIDPKEGAKEAQDSLDELRRRFPDFPPAAVHAVTGSAGDVNSVTTSLGYRYAWDEDIGQYAHVAAVAVLTADGKLSRWLYGIAPDPTDVKLALTEAGRGSVGTWTDQLLLLCYHYDPATGRYGSMIWTMLRVGGGVTVALGFGLIGVAFMRERRSGKRGGA